MHIEFDTSALDKLLEKLKSIESDYKPKVEESLREVWQEIDSDIESAVSPHYRTSKLSSSRIRSFNPRWEGDVISCPVGFDFANKGAVHAILLKNGTGARSTKTTTKWSKPHYTGVMPVDGAVKSALDENKMKDEATDKMMDCLAHKIFKF